MMVHAYKLVTRWSETGPDGNIHLNKYAVYYEEAQIDALRAIGLSYKTMEETGIIIPALSYEVSHCQHVGPEELLTIVVTVAKPPTIKVTFDFKAFNSQEQLVNTASMVNVIVNSRTNRPCYLPLEYNDRIKAYFN